MPTIATVHPYTPLELEGRDLYIREGCVGCHSQMVRPIRAETERYGEYSKAGEFVYDHPFLWGSKRTGPDLHRVGGKYPDSWHFLHMQDPTCHLAGLDHAGLSVALRPGRSTRRTSRARSSRCAGSACRIPPAYENPSARTGDRAAQARRMSADRAQRRRPEAAVDAADREIVALIAYLQRLGTDIKAAPAAEPTSSAALAAPATGASR